MTTLPTLSFCCWSYNCYPPCSYSLNHMVHGLP